MYQVQRSRAATVQWAIVWLGFAVFVVTARLFGRPMYWPLAGSAVLLWGTMAAIAWRLGPARPAGYYEPLVVMFACIIPVVVGLVVSGAREFDLLVVIPIALVLWLGQAMWALLRYPTLPTTQSAARQTWLANARWGLAWGAAAAAIYAIIAAGLFGLGALSGESPPADYPSLPAIVVSYFVGFLATGLLVGLLRPLARFSLGTMLLGTLGAFCVYGAVGVPMLGFPLRWEHLFLGLAMALLVGPAFGLGIRTRSSQ